MIKIESHYKFLEEHLISQRSLIHDITEKITHDTITQSLQILYNTSLNMWMSKLHSNHQRHKTKTITNTITSNQTDFQNNNINTN